MAELARQLGVSDNLVSATVRGIKNNRKVLQALRSIGCPEDILALPKNMKEAA
jgi:transposase-like protein